MPGKSETLSRCPDCSPGFPPCFGRATPPARTASWRVLLQLSARRCSSCWFGQIAAPMPFTASLQLPRRTHRHLKRSAAEALRQVAEAANRWAPYCFCLLSWPQRWEVGNWSAVRRNKRRLTTDLRQCRCTSISAPRYLACSGSGACIRCTVHRKPQTLKASRDGAFLLCFALTGSFFVASALFAFNRLVLALCMCAHWPDRHCQRQATFSQLRMQTQLLVIGWLMNTYLTAMFSRVVETCMVTSVRLPEH